MLRDQEEMKLEVLDSYFQGQQDGEMAGGQGSMFLGGAVTGILFGPFGYLGVLAVNPSPTSYHQQSFLKGKSDDYYYGFCEGLKGKQRSMFLRGNSLGWGVWIAIVLIASASASSSGY